MPTVNVIAPDFPESEKEVTLHKWLKSVGASVTKGEPLAELETSTLLYELSSPCFGSMQAHCVNEGAVIDSVQNLAVIEVDEKMELEHSRLNAERMARQAKYCCSEMFEAVTSSSASLKFNNNWFRGEGYWEMKTEDEKTVGFPNHCPWCGKPA